MGQPPSRRLVWSIRDALREHLKRLHYRELERKEQEAYARTPDDPAEFAIWDKVAAWPKK